MKYLDNLQQLWFEQRQLVIAALVMSLACLLLLFSLISEGRGIIQAIDHDAITTTPANNGDLSQQQTQQINQLSKMPIFGEAETTEIRVNQSGPYQVMGILLGPSAKTSQAVIKQGNQEDVYFVGDKIADRHRIREIQQDRVIILRNGKLEALLLKIDDISSSGASLTESKPIATQVTKPLNREQLQQRVDKQMQRMQNSPYFNEQIKQRLEQYRNRLGDKP